MSTWRSSARPEKPRTSTSQKGWLVAVDGRLEYGEWETEGGEKRHDYSVVGNVEFLTAPRSVEAEEPAKPAARKKREPVSA
jgi:single-stranded DNA-binding protein